MVKQSKIINQQPKTLEIPNIIDTKSITIEHQTSCKLSKTIWQAKKVSQACGAGKNSTSPLYNEMTKNYFF